MSSLPRLYLVTNRRRIAGPGLLQALDQAFGAGVRLAMLRERELEARDLLALAKQAVARAAPFGARVVVNDRLDIALLAGAAGVHLRESSVPLAEARRLMWAGALIGVSVHDEENAARAVGAGASLVLFGPVYETLGKVRYRPPQGIAALARAARAMRSAAARVARDSRDRESARVPLYAIGGITPERVAECIDAGAHGVAVMGGILTADSIPARVREYLRAIHRAVGESIED